ncbi:hypothetical protein, partial [Rothia sp. HMSC072E10]|uniref:hypothetical protein n=1 Tax=Rothia sp. HMSC072E10 TaxID=1739448 RepID=UPI001AEFFD4E
ILRLGAIKVLNTHQRAKRINASENNQESTHDGFSFRAVGEYPEVGYRQVAYLPQGYSMCLKALISGNVEHFDGLWVRRLKKLTRHKARVKTRRPFTGGWRSGELPLVCRRPLG